MDAISPPFGYFSASDFEQLLLGGGIIYATAKAFKEGSNLLMVEYILETVSGGRVREWDTLTCLTPFNASFRFALLTLS